MKKYSVRKIISELLLYLVIVLLCMFVVPKYIIQRTIVNGTSMQDTLHTGESLLVEKITHHFNDPDRYDIVVFYPFGKDTEEYYVKRVIGLPGETIQIKDNNIYINGEIIEDNFSNGTDTYPGIAAEPLELGSDEFFMIGDNRADSYDSRYMDIGPITRDKISGRAILRMYPFNKFGILK